MRIIYLHGFASSPASRKAQVFRERLVGAGATVSVPQLDGGDFERLTISGQLAILEGEARGQPVTLIGSSMGGYLAALYAASHDEVEKLVLMAPAFGFQLRWPALLGPAAFEAWKSTGRLEVFHYGDLATRPVGWQLVEDAMQFDPVPDFSQPALVFHGRKDVTVPVEASETYAVNHPNVQLYTFDAGHELTEVIDDMWKLTARFLGIAGR